MHKLILLLITFSIGTAMAQTKGEQKKKDNFLEKLMQGNPLFANLLAKKDSMRIQIVYTQINRDANNMPSFKTFTYNLDHNLYFYPASTAKMPTAFLALQRLNELNKAGLNKNTTMLTDSAWDKQTTIYHDPTSADGRASIAHYIKQVFMVSDNEANNRLYEFLGQEYINKELQKLGYKEAQILHRLGVSFPDDANRHTNPIRFVDENGKTVYEQPAQLSQLNYLKRNNLLGKGYYKNNVLVNEPFNFSIKNRLHLDDMNDMLLRVLFPEAYPAKQRFNLSDADYKFLYQYMSQMPTESTFPAYDSTEFYDAYCKFIMYGSEKGSVPKNIRIFNKVGDAYGFLTDITYFVDFENNIEFALSATIHVNEDGIFNDDKYEYETVGLPFMKNLGQTIYDYELKRERKVKPDLTKFKMVYDK
jgi:Beta-lactamase enzyme family